MRLAVLGSLILLASTGHAAPSSSLNIGPYYLGMTNSEAAKTGLSDCRESSRETMCKGSLGLSDGRLRVSGAELSFNSKTKKLIAVKAHVMWNAGSYPTFEELNHVLGARPCKPSSSFVLDGQSEICSGGSRQSRFMLRTPFYGGKRSNQLAGYLVKVEIKNDDSAAKNIQRYRAEERKKKQIIDFQIGK